MRSRIALFSENYERIKRNSDKIEKLNKIGTKKARLAAYMLGGRPVTGAIMIRKFSIYSYRDAIFSLSKEYKIKSKTIIEKAVSHKIWWLEEFDEEFILNREQKIF